eukprot:CAMPEP_0182912514 /NCGR_PEP_ID=MMETSP0034_2-20130328/37552_1 /TAXON_ID=156128 /ORGANISM="Nephroselmis pyriformis, Strain CCMP717" /LENGTH=378 /DNA_ID=CAMNT_0025049189 /DNA_START=8 /DNA_END=1144 /DNA_ORIENTATION=+
MPSDGHIPGYKGYIPGGQHVLGKTYREFTKRAGDAVGCMKHGDNPAKLVTLVDSRPQGRDFLYAQATQAQPTGELGAPHVGKRKPIVNFGGAIDFRLAKTVIGGNLDYTLPTIKTMSLPALPFANRVFQTRKTYAEELPAEAKTGKGNLPGYTGHEHASQHVFAKSYGTTSRQLHGKDSLETTVKSKSLITYTEDRPQGPPLQGTSRIPGYSGYLPAKDNHIYAQTYGSASSLATGAFKAMSEGQSASTMEQLVDTRPTGKTDLYAQADRYGRTGEPNLIRVSMGRVKADFKERTKDYKTREKVGEDVREVMKGRHKVLGYTGHIHGEQHVFAESYGKMTGRTLSEIDKSAPTGDALLSFKYPHPCYEKPSLAGSRWA